jgi:hypothetical protein
MSEPEMLSDSESWNNTPLREQLAFLLDFEGNQADELSSAWHWYNRGWEAHKRRSKSDE